MIMVVLQAIEQLRWKTMLLGLRLMRTLIKGCGEVKEWALLEERAQVCRKTNGNGGYGCRQTREGARQYGIATEKPLILHRKFHVCLTDDG
jgi:hypothetical protein